MAIFDFLRQEEVGDFYGPFFSIRFFTSVGEARDFATRKGIEIERVNPTTREPISIDGAVPTSPDLTGIARSGQAIADQPELTSFALQNYKSNLEIKIKAENQATITLTLTPPYEDAIAILDSKIIRTSTVTLVEWGYASVDGNITSGPYLFRNNKPTVDFGNEIIITISGEDILAANLSRQENKRTWPRNGGYSNDSLILKALANQMKMKLDLRLVPEVSSLFEDKTDQNDDLQQIHNDWLFFKELIRQHHLSFVMVEGDNVLVYDESLVLRREPSYRFFWYGQAKTPYDVPMITFSTDVQRNLFETSISRSVANVIADLNSGASKRTEIKTDAIQNQEILGKNTRAGNTQNNLAINTSAGSPIADLPIPADQVGHTVSQPAFKQNSTEIGRAKAREGLAWASTQATAVVPGLPKLSPPQLVLVEGVGETFSGVFKVKAVTHVIGTEGYVTNVEMIRHAQARVPTQETQQPAIPKNEPTNVSGNQVSPTPLPD